MWQELKDRLVFTGIGGVLAAFFGWSSGVVGTILGAMAGAWLFVGFGAVIGFFAGPDLIRRFCPWLSTKLTKFRSAGRKY